MNPIPHLHIPLALHGHGLLGVQTEPSGFQDPNKLQAQSEKAECVFCVLRVMIWTFLDTELPVQIALSSESFPSES